jgi:hypothetical protein
MTHIVTLRIPVDDVTSDIEAVAKFKYLLVDPGMSSYAFRVDEEGKDEPTYVIGDTSFTSDEMIDMFGDDDDDDGD